MFAQIPQVPGVDVESTRFRVAHGVADSVYFASPLKDLKPKRLEEGEAVYQGRDYVYSPGAVRYSPWRPGLEFYFPLDMRLTIKTDLSPYLTWAEGSVGAEVPAAPSQWYLLNFRDGQAPLMFVFEEPVQLMVTGDSGNWTLAPRQKFKGWMRVLAPIGPKRVAANVSALGELAQKIKPLANQLSKPMPTMVNFEVRSDSGYLTAIWNFDRVGAVIPSPLILSKAGGYETRILTGITPVLADFVEGPVAFSKEPRIAVRFPMRRIAAGRSLIVGDFANTLSSASGFDVPSVVELALSHLAGGQDALTRDVVTTCADEFRRGITSYADPVTGMKSFVPADGAGIDLLAAQALLQSSEQLGSHDFLDGVVARWDPWSWEVLAAAPAVQSRGTALFAVAGAFSDDPVVRAKAAMAHAACAAESVIGDYARKRDLPVLIEKSIQPMKELRDVLFGEVALAPNEPSFVRSLVSPVRVVGGPPVKVQRDGEVYILSWDFKEGDRNELALVTEYPIEVEARENLASIMPSTFLAETRLKMVAKGPGVCKIALRLPPWALDLPSVVDAPRYSE